MGRQEIRAEITPEMERKWKSLYVDHGLSVAAIHERFGHQVEGIRLSPIAQGVVMRLTRAKKRADDGRQHNGASRDG